MGRPSIVAALVWTAMGASACGSGSDNRKATAFSSSPCKREAASKASVARLRSLDVITSEAGLDGLRCVAWQRVSTHELKLDLYNFDSACGATWTGDGAVDANGVLDLRVDNPSCQIAKCGKCLYDWSFDLPVTVAADQAVQLDIAIDTCAGQQDTVYLSAALGPEPEGIRCELADYGALNEQAATLGTCGQSGMPCIGSLLCGSGGFTSTGTCAVGLVCDSSAATNQPVCLVPCSSNTDCPRADVWSCQAGLCRPGG